MTLTEILNEMEFYGMTELSEHIASCMVSSHPGYLALLTLALLDNTHIY